jgi:hypothetical protein
MSDWNGMVIPQQLKQGVYQPAARAPLSWVGCTQGPKPPPVYGVVGDLDARLTTAGRILNARQLVEGLSFEATAFAVGTGGYYESNPTQAIPVNPGDSGLQAEVLRKGFALVEHPIPEAITLYCRLEKLEAPYALGELGVFVTILDSPLNPGEVGDVVLYALVHFPIDAHNLSKVCAWRVSITY